MLVLELRVDVEHVGQVGDRLAAREADHRELLLAEDVDGADVAGAEPTRQPEHLRAQLAHDGAVPSVVGAVVGFLQHDLPTAHPAVGVEVGDVGARGGRRRGADAGHRSGERGDGADGDLVVGDARAPSTAPRRAWLPDAGGATAPAAVWPPRRWPVRRRRRRSSAAVGVRGRRRWSPRRRPRPSRRRRLAPPAYARRDRLPLVVVPSGAAPGGQQRADGTEREDARRSARGASPPRWSRRLTDPLPNSCDVSDCARSPGVWSGSGLPTGCPAQGPVSDDRGAHATLVRSVGRFCLGVKPVSAGSSRPGPALSRRRRDGPIDPSR